MLTLETYNRIRGTHFAESEHNLYQIEKLNKLGVTEDEVKAYTLPAGSRQHELRQMASDFAKARKAAPAAPKAMPAAPKAEPAPAPKAEPKTEPKAEPKAKEENATMTTSNDKTTALIEALNGLLAPNINLEEVRKMVAEAVEEKIKDVRPIKLEVTSPRGVNVVKGVLHEQFEDIVTVVNDGFFPLLYGPAGSGKTQIAKQVAEALGLDFYYSGQLSQEYQFTGFTDANGRYQPTPFYNAWTKGGLMFFDELTKSDTEPCTRLNGALSNDVFDFPAPIGSVKRHPDFHCMAAGNSIGRGASGSYVSENQQDSSFLDRFFPIEVLYDKRIEDAISKEAADFVRALRKAVDLAGIDLVLGYRAIIKLANFVGRMPTQKLVKSVITASLSKDAVNILKRDANVRALAEAGNQFAKALV